MNGIKLIKTRRSVQQFRPDAIPEGKIVWPGCHKRTANNC